MWQEKEDIISPGQTAFARRRLQDAHVRNTTLPPPLGSSNIGSPGGSSRKRKSTTLGSPVSTAECFTPWKPHLEASNSLLGLNRRGNNHERYLDKPNSIEPFNFRHQFDNQHHYQDGVSENWPTADVNFPQNGIERTRNASYSLSSQSLQTKGLNPFVEKMPAEETHVLSNRQTKACYGFNQTEAPRVLPFLNSYNSNAEKSHVGSDLQNLMSFGTKNDVFTQKMSRETGFSERLRPVEIVQQNLIHSNSSSDGISGKVFLQEEFKFHISCGLEGSVFCSQNGGIENLSNVVTSTVGTSVCAEQESRSLGSDVKFGTAPSGICFRDKSECKQGDHGNRNIKLKEARAAQDIEKSNLAMNDDKSSENIVSQDESGGRSLKIDPSHGSFKLDEKSKPSERTACTVAEKLWDGSLQLSNAVTLSAVAFFKSGEKLLGNNWPEFVEVKGKVRLEAFEKYIQDLPRSRTRGLMVVSLCWKEGSSVTGRAGMKEVARAYAKGARVGYAQFSPGTDLYICPRSNTIITILAKYGFFKGMAAIDDKQDSLIGCVVWRKGPISSNSDGRKMDKNSSLLSSGQTLNSPSCSSTQQGADKKFSPTKLAQDSSQLIHPVVIPSSATLDNAGENGIKSVNIKSGELHKVGNSACNANSLPFPSMPSNCSSIAAGQLTPCSSYSPMHNPVGSHPCNMKKQTSSLAEDDDLPEFDFGVASGISATSMNQPYNHATLDRKLPAERTKNENGSVPVTHQRSDNPSLALLPSAAKQVASLPNRFSEPRILGFPNSEEKHSVVSNTTEIASDELTKKKKLFDDDDDDMPEWCPPELHNQSLVEASRPLTIESLNSNFHTLPPPPPRPPIPPPSPVDTHSSFSYQPFRPAFHCRTSTSVRAPQPVPFQGHSNSSKGLRFNPAMSPHSNSSNANSPPFPFANGRDRRP